MMEEKEGVKRQNSKKGSEMSEHACIVEGVFVILNSTASQYSTLAGQTWKNQSFPKL